jgi:nitrogen regulatory protein PII
MNVNQMPRPLLVVLILNDINLLERVIDDWEVAGASGATVLDCAGRRQVKEALQEDDVPLFPSLANLLREHQVAQKLIFSIVEDGPTVDRIIEATEQVIGNLFEEGKGILFVMPLNFVMGLRPVRKLDQAD